MTIEQILEIIERYKLRIPSTVFYDLKADILNYEEQEPTTKNDLGIDCISRQAAIDAIRRIHPIDTDYDCTLFDKVDVMYVLNDLPSVTPQEPKPMVEIDLYSVIKQKYIERDVLDKIRAEIAKYGSIWVEYKITGRRDKDIEQLVHDVIKQAKEQVLDVIDNYKADRSEEQTGENT